MTRRLMSFVHAARGIQAAAREPNMIIHLLMSVVVLALGIFMEISQLEYIILLILIGITLSAEIFNSAIERMCDRVTREEDDLIKTIKDLSAGAVLVIAIIDVIIGGIIFWPYIKELLT